MRLVHFALVAALLFGFAAPAAAGKGGSLVPGGRTLAGPGLFSLSGPDQVTVFSDTDSSANVCVTVANTGKSSLNFIVTGDATPNTSVDSGETRSVCVKNVATVEIACTASCSAQWRVDDN